MRPPPWRRLGPAVGLVLALAVLAALPSSAEEPALALAEPLDLSGPWRFRTGDDPSWAAPSHDDTSWATLRVPGDWGRQGHEGYAGVAWYRLAVPLPEAARRGELPLSVAIGRVHSAYELYAGGRLIGAVGRFPPHPETRYDREVAWPLPASAVAADGNVLLALRVWRGDQFSRAWQGGPYEGSFLLGEAGQVARRLLRGRTAPLVLAVLYVLVGLYHVHLYRRRRALVEYLWYGLLAVFIGAYAFLVSPWKHELALPWLVVKRLEYAVLEVLPALCLQSVWTLLGVRPGRLLRAYQASFVGLGLAALAAPTLRLLFLTLDTWRVWMLPCAVGLAALVAVKAWRGHAEARTVMGGVAAFTLATLNDAAVDLRFLHTPRLVTFGFAIFIASMAWSLANRFTRVFRELEEKTLALERAQADLLRTGKLSAIGGMAAGLVHDLRNPVGAIHTYATLIAEQSTPEQARMLRRILDETTRSVDMMEDVLAFARGHVSVAPRAVEVGPWFSELAAYLERELELSMVEVGLSGDLQGVARFDPGRLRRVLCNLAWNARDALPDGGHFQIDVQRLAGRLRVTCTDDGPGVPPEIVPRLFQEFATHGKANGTGLGLALSRAIVAEHGGTLGYEPGAGGGARFVLELPQEPEVTVRTEEEPVGGGRPPAPEAAPGRSA
jgi:signal transduction histidine kinase